MKAYKITAGPDNEWIEFILANDYSSALTYAEKHYEDPDVVCVTPSSHGDVVPLYKKYELTHC